MADLRRGMRTRRQSTPVIMGVAVAVLGALLSIPTTASMRVADASGLPLLSHHGRWLTDPQGRVVILHGLQIDHWETGAPVNVIDLSPQNVSFMATMGFNLARVSMTYSGVAPVPGSFDQLYVDDFVAFDHELASNGIYDLLDMMQGEYSQAVGGWGFPNWMTMTNGVPNTETPFPNGY